MAIRVQIPAPLRSLTGGADEVQVEAGDVGALVEALEAKHKGLKDRLCDPAGELRSLRARLRERRGRPLPGRARRPRSRPGTPWPSCPRSPAADPEAAGRLRRAPPSPPDLPPLVGVAKGLDRGVDANEQGRVLAPHADVIAELVEGLPHDAEGPCPGRPASST